MTWKSDMPNFEADGILLPLSKLPEARLHPGEMRTAFKMSPQHQSRILTPTI